MGKTGRKPKSEEQHDLDGTARAGRRSPDRPNPPAALVIEPLVPLVGVARDVFDLEQARLSAMGMLTPSYAVGLTYYALHVAHGLAASAELDALMAGGHEAPPDGLRYAGAGRTLMMLDGNDRVRAVQSHPAAARFEAASKMVRSWASEFGGTPASLQGLKKPPGEDEEDALTKLMRETQNAREQFGGNVSSIAEARAAKGGKAPAKAKAGAKAGGKAGAEK